MHRRCIVDSLLLKRLSDPAQVWLFQVAAERNDVKPRREQNKFPVCFQKMLGGSDEFFLFAWVNACGGSAKLLGVAVADLKKYKGLG